MRLVRAAAVVAVAVLGCSLVTSYDGFEGEPAGKCGKSIPTPTAGASGGGSLEIVGISSSIRFLPEPGAPVLGYDLDDTCTCPARGSCRSSSLGTSGPCDGDAGIDNNLGGTLKGLFSDSTPLLQAISAGRVGLVVRVRGYNGKSDDSDLIVSLYNVGAIPNGAKFDGTDKVDVTDGSFFASTPTPDLGSKYTDTSAYVAGGFLVAHFARFELRLEVPQTFVDAGGKPAIVAVPLTDAALVGKLRVESNGLAMDAAQLVGRVTFDDAVHQLENVGICGDAVNGLKKSFCEGLDLAARAVDDGRDAPCAAFSAAMGLRVVPATLGSHVAVTEPGSTCAHTVATCP